MASVPGRVSAAETPCTARAGASNGSEGLSAQPSEASPKPASPTSTSRRCPSRSPMPPDTSSSEASGRAYASTTQASPVPSGASARPIDGSATLTAVTSSRIRK